jgi:demethylmenaquinone methyltransferase / 2-methoxy-6-polyprenyl-1,4-benzoquinol methylase
VRPGGRIALLDVGVPTNPVIRLGQRRSTSARSCPRSAAALRRAAYRYLPKSVAYLPEPAEMVAMLRRAGFSDASHHQLSGGLTQLLLGTRD